jgi:hypothetical protein
MEDWKKDRLGAEIKESEKKIMAEAAAKNKAEAKAKEDAAWESIKADLNMGDYEYDKYVNLIVDSMREYGYELPKRN